MSRNENNLDTHTITQLRSLLSYDTTNPVEHWRKVQRILSILENIFSSPATGAALSYFCQHGAATAWLLQVQLEMPEGTVYRTLKRLRALNFIEPVFKIPKKKGSLGGPRPKVWSLKGASTEEVAWAIRTHRRAESPKYRHAEKLIQSPLIVSRVDLLNEVTRRQLLEVAREQLPAPMRRDVIIIAMEILRDQGVKVLI